MSHEVEMETSARILSIASRYIIVSVLVIAIGAVSIVYALLIFLVSGAAGLIFEVAAGIFMGLAFAAIGLFIGAWGLFWMRTEGKRLRKMLEAK